MDKGVGIGTVIALHRALGGGGGGGGGSSGGGALIVDVNVTEEDLTIITTANKTAGEIINAMPLVYVVDEDVGDAATSVTFRYFSTDGDGHACYYILPDGAGYGFIYTDAYGSDHVFSAATLNDYPTDIKPK